MLNFHSWTSNSINNVSPWYISKLLPFISLRVTLLNAAKKSVSIVCTASQYILVENKFPIVRLLSLMVTEPPKLLQLPLPLTLFFVSSKRIKALVFTSCSAPSLLIFFKSHLNILFRWLFYWAFYHLLKKINHKGNFNIYRFRFLFIFYTFIKKITWRNFTLLY